MKVLIACEFSGIVRDAFAKREHDAWSCDLLPTERPGPHIRGDIFDVLERTGNWDLLVFHWPCTYLTRAGAGWLYNRPKKPNPNILYLEPRRQAMIEHAHLFRKLLDCEIPKVCGENPRPYKDALKIMGPFSQVIQPWQYGHGEVKATCLWLRGLPLLVPTNIVEGRSDRCHRESPGPDRWKNRSRTYEGVARAMAEQWG